MTIHKTDHMMRVRNVIAYLQKLDPEAYVVLSSDSEGNGFSPLSDCHGEGLYEAECTWSGNWIDLTDESYINGEASYDKENSHKAIFLFPVN